MQQKQPVISERINYYFTKVKDTHLENGQRYITLFARLTVHKPQEAKSVWVEIDEVKWEHASWQLRTMPRGEYTYRVAEEVFQEMQWLSGICHEELYFLTPLYEVSKFRSFD